MTRPRRMLTVDMAADEIQVSANTVYRWISKSDPALVHREYVRLPDARSRMIRKQVVDVNGLRDYGEQQRPGRPAA